MYRSIILLVAFLTTAFAFSASAQTDAITGTWVGTQNCSEGLEKIKWNLRATSPTSFSGTWPGGTPSSFNGSIQGTILTWGISDARYELSLQTSGPRPRLVGTQTWGVGIPPCKVELTKVMDTPRLSCAVCYQALRNDTLAGVGSGKPTTYMRQVQKNMTIVQEQPEDVLTLVAVFCDSRWTSASPTVVEVFSPA